MTEAKKQIRTWWIYLTGDDRAHTRYSKPKNPYDIVAYTEVIALEDVMPILELMKRIADYGDRLPEADPQDVYTARKLIEPFAQIIKDNR